MYGFAVTFGIIKPMVFPWVLAPPQAEHRDEWSEGRHKNRAFSRREEVRF